MRITDLSIAKRATIFFLMVAAVAAGVNAYLSLPREAFPDIEIPQVIVYVRYPGAAPEDVESQITDPLEREIQGIDGLDTISSVSQESVSVVTVEFVSGTDIDDALQKVRDRVDRAKADFPDEAEEPVLQETEFSDIPVVQVNLAGDVGPAVLKRLAEDLQDALEALPGVLRANLVGGLEREVKVDVDPDRLRLYDLSLQDVIDAVGAENVSIPGGDLDLGERSYAVRVPGEVENPLDVGRFVIKTRGGSPIFVSDVAKVSYGFKDRDSYARINGDEAVALTIQKRQGSNVLDVVSRVRQTVDRVTAAWPDAVEVVFLADLSEDVELMVHDLENNILSGLVLVVVVLMFALGFRNSLFVGVAIPFSMLLAFVVLQLSGITLNNVVLFSLVLAVGMLVDNAVVVIENNYRHMQEGETRVNAARHGTHEVGAAILVSTLTTVAAFSPLLFWPGVVGDFMVYMPMTVSIVLSASLLVALTVNPVLSATFMGLTSRDRERLAARASGEADRGDEVEPESVVGRVIHGFGRGLSGIYESNLAWALRHRVVVIGATVLAFVGIVILFGMFNHGVEFFPETEPRQIFIDVDLPPGTRVERTDEVVRELERRLTETPDLETMAASAGAGSQAQFGASARGDVTQGRITLDLVDREDRVQSSFTTMDWVREETAGIPGVEIDVKRPDEGPPVGQPLEIEISGDDFATLGEIAARIENAIEDVPGLVSLTSDFDLARPEVIVDVDRTQASRLGLTTADIASTVRTAVTGTEASTYRKGDEDDDVDITVRLQESARRSLEDLARLTVRTEDGAQIPIASIATIRRGSALTSIKHKDARRVVTVSGDVTSPELAEPVRTEAQRRIAEMGDLLPVGYSLASGGQSEEEEEAKDFLTQAFLYGVLLVLALMVAKFDSVTIPLIITTSVLMSMIGVLGGLLVTGLPFGIIMTGLGVISLAGIVVNNAIVLLDYGEQLWAQGLPREEVVRLTGARRMRPVLLTAITTILGLIPLTTGVEFDFVDMRLATGGESSQWWKGMGVAVIFGLAFATFLTLILVPVLYDLLLQVREWAARRRSGGEARGAGEPADSAGVAAASTEPTDDRGESTESEESERRVAG